ncbi:hypothetical protein CK203_104683 [Vitis vinifera]|uniref:Serine/threonine-protein phosphatase 7 long form-like n=1 Tax=Vitis vinifera TaxID=29760 RepID=A0A438CWE2_VITVI|nr:hypothetical protein CK203_104683 [Vitis vinifera]
MGRPSRSLPHAPVPIDERLLPDALGSIPPTSYIDSDRHSINQYGRAQFDWRLYHERYVALWEAKRDHIVTSEPISYGLPCSVHDMVPSYYTSLYYTYGMILDLCSNQVTALSVHLLTMTSIISRGGHVLEDSDSDVFRTGIVDIIRIATDVMCIFREDYRIPHVEHGRGRFTPAISRVRQGLRRPRLLPPPLPLFLAPTPSQTDILYVSHAVLTTVREERPKRKRVPVTHSFSPCGGI